MFRRSALALAAAIGIGALVPGMSQPTPMVTINAPRRAKRGLFGGIQLAPQTNWTYRGPGTTMAQQQRASRKARNVKRHKRATRG
jgi:hypothetical protein